MKSKVLHDLTRREEKVNESSSRQPEALWFGYERARCFGMLHEPEATSNRGVVFCNALGFEGSIARRAFRHLADDLTARGFWALRFEYDGEGDSAGGSWEPARLAAWVASIDAAVCVLRARGVTDVRLVGFRVGASLAYLYATAHSGISATVLWSPCVRGSAYVREQRARSRLSAAARPPQRVPTGRFPDDSLEVVGYEFSGESLRELGDIDLVEAPTAVHPRAVLVVDRDDAPENDDLVRKLVESGSRVEHRRMSGYEEFVTEGEDTSELPWLILRCIEDWLDALRTTATLPAVIDERLERVVESGTLSIDDPTAGRFSSPGPARDCVVETPSWIAGRFFAITSSPAGTMPTRRTAIVLCNTGSVNRTGPGRLYVTLARYWANLGFTVVRIDLGGAGDSFAVDPSTENQPHAPVRVDELREVLTCIQRTAGVDRIVVSGVCSGAFNAFHAAIDGQDIDHLMLVNPGTFYLGSDRTFWTSEEAVFASAQKLTRGFFNRRRWNLALRDREVMRRGLRSVGFWFQARPISGLRVLAVTSVRRAANRLGVPVKTSSALARDLDQMLARGVKVFMVFAAGEPSSRYLKAFGGPAFRARSHGNGLEIVDIDGGDHSFSSPGARQVLIETMTQYLEREYPFPAASGDIGE